VLIRMRDTPPHTHAGWWSDVVGWRILTHMHAGWWSDGLVGSQRMESAETGAEGGGEVDAAGGGRGGRGDVVVCYLEHRYVADHRFVGESEGTGGDGRGAERKGLAAGEGGGDAWCLTEGGACRAAEAGGSEMCAQGLPDLIGGGIWLHTRRSSDWDLLLDMVRAQVCVYVWM
jgi:hypothetical protein